MNQERIPGKIMVQTEWIALGCIALSGIGIGVGWWLSATLGLLSGWGMVFFGGVTGVCGGLAYVHARLERYAYQERQEELRLAEGRQGLLFEDVGSAGERVRIWSGFERWGVGLGTVVLLGLEGFGAWKMIALVNGMGVDKISSVTSSSFSYGLLLGLGGVAFMLLMFGRYTSGLGYGGGQRQLRGLGALTLMSGYLILGTVLVMGFCRMRVESESGTLRDPDALMLWGYAAIMGIWAIDHTLGLIMAYYRPKRKGESTIPAYEGRLTGFLSNPEGGWATIAELIDYQFGFKLSQTHVFRFATRMLLPLIAIQSLTLICLSSVVVVPLGKLGMVQRFGALRGDPLPSGLHFKLPWPVEGVQLVGAETMQRIEVGGKELNKGVYGLNRQWTALESGVMPTAEVDGRWRVTSGMGDGNRMVEDIIQASLAVDYRVTDHAAFYFQHQDGVRELNQLAEGIFVRALSSLEGGQLLQGGADRLTKEIKETLQAVADASGLGVKVELVGFTELQPPMADGVAEAYRALADRENLSQSELDRARIEALKTGTEATGIRATMLGEAQSVATRRTLVTQSESERFKTRQGIKERFGPLYFQLSYLNVLESALLKPRKLILAVPRKESMRQVMQLDLKSEINPDLLEMKDAAPSK